MFLVVKLYSWEQENKVIPQNIIMVFHEFSYPYSEEIHIFFSSTSHAPILGKVSPI